MEKKIVTRAGLEALKAELSELTLQSRKEIAKKIKEAREQGDLSENAEYDVARDEQRAIEARIAELEAIVKNAEVIDTETITEDAVNVGHTVRVRNEEMKREIEYRIVGSSEANAAQGRISNESPIGRSLLGRKVGERVTVEVPAGEIHLTILEIQ